ncbi:hypothetical protein KSP40_PGU002929 [Platanthera guangdongensis]|uniref:Uncharacterized protein n=1 Tax=Platanthera guangdongensis TaxID=2320717 RepID=A0ABR2M5F0_9ASPA
MEAPRKWWSRRRRAGGRDYADRFTLPTIDDFQPLDTQGHPPATFPLSSSPYVFPAKPAIAFDLLFPCSASEQEEMIRSFEREHQRQSRLWRGVFSVFLLGYGGFLIYSNFQQAWNPWELDKLTEISSDLFRPAVQFLKKSDLRLLILLIIHCGSETAHLLLISAIMHTSWRMFITGLPFLQVCDDYVPFYGGASC